jgi:hypothetical protein
MAPAGLMPYLNGAARQSDGNEVGLETDLAPKIHAIREHTSRGGPHPLSTRLGIAVSAGDQQRDGSDGNDVLKQDVQPDSGEFTIEESPEDIGQYGDELNQEQILELQVQDCHTSM